jgi:hypothetical protein
MLAKRYAVRAAQELTGFEAQKEALLLTGINIDLFKQTIIQPILDTSAFINHWKYVMYVALMEVL